VVDTGRRGFGTIEFLLQTGDDREHVADRKKKNEEPDPNHRS